MRQESQRVFHVSSSPFEIFRAEIIPQHPDERFAGGALEDNAQALHTAGKIAQGVAFASRNCDQRKVSFRSEHG
jgi:hypothetical protein